MNHNYANMTSDGPILSEALMAPRQQSDGAPPMLLHYWHVVQRWKWYIGGIILLCTVAGIIATLLMTPQYSATAQIEIQREEKNITNVQGIDSPQSGRDEEFYQTQYSLLQARSLAERVARTQRLASRDDFFAAFGIDPESIGQGTEGLNTSVLRGAISGREKLAVDLLLKNVSVSPIRQSRLVNVTFTSADPKISASIANAWIDQFIQASMDRRFDSTADARKYLEGRLEELRQRVESSERELVTYAEKKGIVPLSTTKTEGGRTVVQQTLVTADLQALNAALAEATAERIAAESAARSGGLPSNSTEALTNGALNVMRQRRAEVAAEYAKMLATYEPGYPKAIALKDQLDSLDSAIAREESRVGDSLQSKYRKALANERELKAKVNQLRKVNDVQQRDSIQYNIYQREADTNRELYDALLQRYKEIGVAGVAANNIAVVDRALAPASPTSPSLPLNLGLSLLAGLVLAAAVVFVFEQVDEGLRNPSDVSSKLGLPLLGIIPETEEEDAVHELSDVKSSVSEAYLSVRSSLALATEHGIPRSLMLTSTRPSEGKSTSALALALVIGRIGHKVIIIDADMRKPSLHTRVGVQNDRGLSNYLAGDDNWRESVVPLEARNAFILPAGPTPPNAAELLSGDRFETLIKSLLQEYDHVILDAPPLLGIADAPLLTRVVEGCVFVIEAEGAPLRGIQAALDRLGAAQAHILGAILTKLKHRNISYGYGYGYGYGYSYGEDNQNKENLGAT